MITITSKTNPAFRRFLELHTSKGLRKLNEALVFGLRVGQEIATDFPEQVLGWVVAEGMEGTTKGSLRDARPHRLPAVTCLALALFEELDLFGIGEPILHIKTPVIERIEKPVSPARGVALVIPFQSPDNVGAMIRTAAALGVTQVLLTEEAAHPFHPKSARAAAGAMMRVPMVRLPSLSEIAFPWAHTVGLTAGGRDLRQFSWPAAGILVPGLEGPGLPEQIRAKAQIVSIPMTAGVESLNGMVAASIALFSWQTAQAIGGK